MISFPNNYYLLQTASDLGSLPRECESLYLDFETSSGNDQLDSLNPWHHCMPIGFAVTVDDEPKVWFVPWRILLSNDDALDWLGYLILSCRQWINQNIKYDWHVFLNALPEGFPECFELSDFKLVCTIALAHLIDSDRTFKGGYSLDVLVLHWLKRDIRRFYTRVKSFLAALPSKDYGRVPLDILAEYSCEQVNSNRLLYKFELQHLPEESKLSLVGTEIELTRVLCDMERNGLRIDPTQVQLAEVDAQCQMLDLEGKLLELIGYAVNPRSNKQMFDLICNRWGQPVVKWTKNATACFDNLAMKMYRESIDTPEPLREIIKLLFEYRKHAQRVSLYTTPWQTLHVDGLLHGDYDQNKRSGRMGCRQPNEQQLDTWAKKLILAG